LSTGAFCDVLKKAARASALLATAHRRDLFLRVLEQTRRRYQFVVVGYAVMPEHFHLLISEPENGDPSVVMKVVKQRFTRLVRKKVLIDAAGTLAGV
jgi:REP element-mobilizing transposase RayT